MTRRRNGGPAPSNGTPTAVVKRAMVKRAMVKRAMARQWLSRISAITVLASLAFAAHAAPAVSASIGVDAAARAQPTTLAAVPAPPSATYVPVTPCRLFDTRSAEPGCGPSIVAARPVSGGTVLRYPVIGPGAVSTGIPADATALVVNVTAVDATAPTFVSVYPDAATRPTVSNLNVYSPNAKPNLVTVPLTRATGGAAAVDFFNSAGTVNLLADLEGYYVPGAGAGYTAITPCRVFDTRYPSGADAGCTNQPTVPPSPLGAAPLTISFTSVAGVPPTATAVTFTLTAVDSTQPGFVRASPAGTQLASPSSNLNVTGGLAESNLVTVPLGQNGAVDFYNAIGSTDLIVDLAGYYEPGTGARFTPLASPCRIYDTRDGTGNCHPDPNVPWTGGGLGAADQASLQVVGVATVPAGATAVVVNITGVNATSPTYISASPDNAPLPTVSNLNLYASQAVPVLAIVSVPPGDPADGSIPYAGLIDLYNNAGSVDVIVDLAGYFS
jgi:hypothetical protein